MRLHLGSGDDYIPGYTNIESPQNKHLKADVYADIITLSYPEESVEEILLGHVFEHFDRPTALFLLGEWNAWLKPGGTIRILVPDFEENARAFLSSRTSFQDKQKLLRHIFGSHEAGWAVHCDGWYYDKFKFVLEKMGFVIISATKIIVQSEPVRYDLHIMAAKQARHEMDVATYKEILSLSMFGEEPTIYGSWIGKIKELKEKQQYRPKKKEKLVLFFSKDRALQLDCALGTLHKYCKDLMSADIKVLYTCSHVDHEVQYARLIDFYPDVEFCKETHFRNNVMYILPGYKYCMFVVDDCIFTNYFEYQNAIDALETNEELIGFSLRLGDNIKTSYMNNNEKQAMPGHLTENGISIFNWQNKEYDFGYPLEISSSVYRTDDIINIIARVPFDGPNSMEAVLDCHKYLLEGKVFLACYPTSVAFCNAINKVQMTFSGNRSGNVPTQDLSDKFHDGYRINTSVFHGYVPKSPHEEHEFLFLNKNIDNENPLISIIIPTFNGSAALKECLASIFRNTDTSYEIYVIDNLKDLESSEYVSKLDKVHLIRNQKNIGPAAARNQALPLVKGSYILFLDDDVILTRHWDKKFLSYFEAFPNVGMIGAKSNWASGIQLVTGCAYSNLLELEKFSQDFGKYERGLVGVPRLVSFCLMMKKNLVDVLGALDDFGLYGYEDDDYSLRAGIAGFNPAVARDIFVHHAGGPFQVGDPVYLDETKKACEKFKEKWKIQHQVGMDIDCREIFKREHEAKDYYIPFQGV